MVASAGEGTEQGGLWLTAEENNMVTLENSESEDNFIWN